MHNGMVFLLHYIHIPLDVQPWCNTWVSSLYHSSVICPFCQQSALIAWLSAITSNIYLWPQIKLICYCDVLSAASWSTSHDIQRLHSTQGPIWAVHTGLSGLQGPIWTLWRTAIDMIKGDSTGMSQHHEIKSTVVYTCKKTALFDNINIELVYWVTDLAAVIFASMLKV